MDLLRGRSIQKKNSVCQAKSGLVLITGMLMLSSLTACQKAEDKIDNSAGQTERRLEETTDETTIEEEASGTEQETIPQATYDSLAFLTDSTEYQAYAEGWNFCDGYDTNFAILEQVGNEPVEAGYTHEAYKSYSLEMEKKIDEIWEKYSLSKLSGFQFIDDYNELCSQAGVGDFCKRASEHVKKTILSGYVYYDGTFLMEGMATLAGSSIHEVCYQFVRVVKNCFTSVYLGFGDITKYNVREYITKKGNRIFFAVSSDTNAYIIVEREKSLIVINVRSDMSDIIDVNDERLKLLADAFDFSAIP